MRKLLLTTTALVAISGGTAFAADLPSKAVAPVVPAIPYANWTGPYIAGIVGIGRMNETATLRPPTPPWARGLYNSACAASATGLWVVSKSATIGRIATSSMALQRIGPGPVSNALRPRPKWIEYFYSPSQDRLVGIFPRADGFGG